MELWFNRGINRKREKETNGCSRKNKEKSNVRDSRVFERE